MKNLSRLSQQVQITNNFAANPRLFTSFFAIFERSRLVLVLVKKSFSTVSCGWTTVTHPHHIQPSTLLSLSSNRTATVVMTTESLISNGQKERVLVKKRASDNDERVCTLKRCIFVIVCVHIQFNRILAAFFSDRTKCSFLHILSILVASFNHQILHPSLFSPPHDLFCFKLPSSCLLPFFLHLFCDFIPPFSSPLLSLTRLFLPSNNS